MIYLFSAFIGLIALLCAGSLFTDPPYGRNAALVELIGGTQFPLLSVNTIGGAQCDIDLTRYGCGSQSCLASVTVSQGSYAVRGRALVERGARLLDADRESIPLEGGDLLLLPVSDQRILKLRFEWRE